MSRTSLTAILLAAGQANRFGSAKQLVLIEGQTLLNRIIEQYKLSEIDTFLVVLGAHYQTIAPTIPADVKTIFCQDWQLGMSESIKKGLSNISMDATHVMIGLADQIDLNCIHVNQLIALSKANRSNIIAAKYNGTLGSPAIFPRQYISELNNLAGDKGARAILQQNIDSIISLDCPNLACDIDSVKDLTDWQNKI